MMQIGMVSQGWLEIDNVEQVRQIVDSYCAKKGFRQSLLYYGLWMQSSDAEAHRNEKEQPKLLSQDRNTGQQNRFFVLWGSDFPAHLHSRIVDAVHQLCTAEMSLKGSADMTTFLQKKKDACKSKGYW
jgi:hypothetical protein